MVSPELLRRYNFFSGLSDTQLKALAMLADEVNYAKGEMIFEECAEATHLYILLEGNVDLFYRSAEEFHPTTHKDFHVGEINPGEVFGISALLEPYALNATAKAAQDCRVVTLNAKELRGLMEKDQDLGYRMMTHTARALMERLGAVRVQLAAAWSS